MKAEMTEINLSIKQYLHMIMPYLHNMINDHKTAKT